MSERRDDRLLEERFAELRADLAARGPIPDARAMLARARAEAAASPELGVVDGGAARRPSRRRFVLAGAWTSAALAAAVAGIMLTGRGGADDADLEFERLVAAYSSELGPAALRSPTSGLLAVPGMELLRSVPSLGGVPAGLVPGTTGADAPSPQEENR